MKSISSFAAIVLSVISMVALLVGFAYLDHYTNNVLQERCEDTGGKYFRSIDSNKSLCKMSTK